MHIPNRLLMDSVQCASVLMYPLLLEGITGTVQSYPLVNSN